MQTNVAFEEITFLSVPIVTQWLEYPEIQAWFHGPQQSGSSIEERGQQIVSGSIGIRGFVFRIDGDPVGYVQTFSFADYPPPIGCPYYDSTWVSLDILIGKPSARGFGYGKIALDAFVRTIVFDLFKAPTCLLYPQLANQRAIRSYLSAGFHEIGSHNNRLFLLRERGHRVPNVIKNE